MHVSIRLYIEKKNQEGTYNLLHDDTVFYDFKKFLNDDFLNFDEFSYVSKESLSEEIKQKYKNGIKPIDSVELRETSISELEGIVDKFIEKSTYMLENTYTALGTKYRKDEHDWGEERYDDDGKIRSDYNPLTFPVNKDMFWYLNDALFNQNLAYELRGILSAIREIFWITEENEKEYRVILVRS